MTGSVLVLGAGIAGLRAAAELVQQRFRVYLLEQKPQIGGKMATIDRAFPTMEHTACALQPLLLVVVNNPNITILTSTELESLESVPGDFKVKARRDDQHAEHLQAGNVMARQPWVGEAADKAALSH